MNAEPTPSATVASYYRVDDLLIDVRSRKVTRNDVDLAIAGLSFDLLLALVRAAPDLVSFDALLDQVWPGVVVGPDVVTQRVKLLRQALSDSAEDPRYILVVRGHGYRMPIGVVPLASASCAVVTTHSKVAESRSVPAAAASDDEPSAAATCSVVQNRRWLLVATVVLIIGAAGLWWGVEYARNRAVKNPLQASIAVIPFANLTGDPSKEYLSDGLAEEMIHALAQVPGLKVPARTSSFAYKGRNIDIRGIAQDLGVSTILEGSVQSAGAHIRITAQLVDAQSGYQIWSQSYDRQFGDIFKLEDELAGAVVQAFRTSLRVNLPDSTPRRSPTQNLDAYQFYLQAQSIVNGAPQSYLAAIALYDEALTHDPKFARALEGRAFMRTALVWQGYPLAHGFVDAQQDAELALMLDPSLAEAKAVLGTLNALRSDWHQAEADFLSAIAADPTDGVLRVQYAGSVLLPTGQLRKAHAEAVDGQRLAPGSGFTASILALVDQAMGRSQDALKFADLSIDRGAAPTEREAVFAIAAARRGDYKQAADHAVKTLPSALLASGGAEMVRLACSALGDPTQQPAALHALDGLTQAAAWKNADSLGRQFVLYLFAKFSALESLNNEMYQMFPAGGTTGPDIVAVGSLWLPEMRAFRQDPRFKALVSRLKMTDYWTEYGPPDGCDLKDTELVCR
ncbi:MAG TPA: winged helix-turn-helix domain-containing protein [Steroidobacteraceae bacterium]|nr:winged helix-turn-helix domain-containing protein [Steroidobacteraceae bacterium]